MSKQNFFLTASRLVGYKNVRVIVEAFAEMPDVKLVVAGSGPDAERIRANAGSNVEFVGFVPEEELRHLMATARAFIFAAEEDFGIVPVEAQGEGTPVLALGRGGALETIIVDGAKPTGIFFDTPTPEAVRAAVRQFQQREQQFDSHACHRNALRFSEHRFIDEFSAFVRTHQQEFASEISRNRWSEHAAPGWRETATAVAFQADASEVAKTLKEPLGSRRGNSQLVGP